MNYSISKILPYVRRYVLLGIYDVLDGEGVPYQRKRTPLWPKRRYTANLSVFSVSAEAREVGTGAEGHPAAALRGLVRAGKRASHDRDIRPDRTVSGK